MFASADYHYRRRKNPVKALYTVISAIKITFIFDKVVAVFQFRISLLGRSSLMAGARHNRMVTGLLWGSYAMFGAVYIHTYPQGNRITFTPLP